MKVLQVNCVYNKGSTGKIVHDVHCELKNRGFASVVCYGRGAKVQEDNVYKTCGELYSKCNNLLTRFTGLMYGGCFFSTNRLIAIVKKEKPDIVHVHCINGYFVNIYRFMAWLNKHHIKTVLTLHAEFMHTANCGHAFECEKWKTGCGNCPRFRTETKSFFLDRTDRSWRKMKNAMAGHQDMIVTSVSPWLMSRAVQSPILADKRHAVVMNGVDTQVFQPQDTTRFRENLGVGNRKVVFHATAAFSDQPDHPKGGAAIIRLAKELPDVTFYVAGRYSITEPMPENLILLGVVSNQQELARYYSMADLTVVTGKRETFSMICAESLCCGTPAVGYKAGGPETVSVEAYSQFVEFGDFDGLKQAVKDHLDQEKMKIDTEETRAFYARGRMTGGYIAVYEELLKGKE